MNNRPLSRASLVLLGLWMGLSPAGPAAGAPVELWVAPGGADTNDGSSNAPLASLSAALEKARGWAGKPGAPRKRRVAPAFQPAGSTDIPVRRAEAAASGLSGYGSNTFISSPTSTISAFPQWGEYPIASEDSPEPAGQPVQDGGVRIILRGGWYPLAGPIRFQPPEFKLTTGLISLEAPLENERKHSTFNSQRSTSNEEANVCSVSIEAAPGEHPVLSGGVAFGNWKKVSGAIPGLPAVARGHTWVANAPKWGGHVLEFRQLWVNDRKAVRAREPNGDGLARLVAWDKTNEVATIPAAALGGRKRPAGLEMVLDQVWEIAILRVKSIHREGANARLTFKQPESRIEFQHPWPPVTVNAGYQAPFFLANAIEFLDEPGEWFEDLAAGKVYYWPRAGEDLASATVIAPALETLVQIQGRPDQPAGRLQFKGLTFAHTTWLRPSRQGHVPLQAGMYLLDARKLSPKGTPYHPGLDNLAWIGRPPAAVSVNQAGHISFAHCTFAHLAAAGLDFETGTHDALVAGCVFRDVGGNGVQLGKFSDPNVETHVPYDPSREGEICAHEALANNLISDCGNEDWGCVGIAVGYARNLSLTHNEIFNLPYTGISVGWGWTKMTNASGNHLVFANRVQGVGRRLGDLGGIYMLSAQPGTVVAENAISDIEPSPWVPDPRHWFYLYLDEGSSFITVRDNWCPAEKFLKNANGPGNVWTNNGPQVSEKIKAAAGLEPAFKYLLNQAP